MLFTIPIPPEATGDTQRDLEALREWCAALHTQLKRGIYNIDASNVSELDAAALYGTLPLKSVNINGANVTITNNGINIRNSNGSQYLRLSGDTLTFCGTVVSP